MPVRTTKKRSHRAHAAVQLEVGNSNSSEDEAPLKPIKQQGRVIPLDTFDDDDSDIPAVDECTGTLNKRLKELDIQACGGRYSSKDQVPKDSKFFDKISMATGIEDKLVLVFGLPRQFNSQNGDWLCPGRQCGHRVSKIENLYALHIAASKSGHEYLKPVIRQSFFRPCRQFYKNPASMLAHEMSHAPQSDCYERNRLIRMLRILDIGEDTFLPSPVRRNAKRKHMSELGIDTSRSPRARKRKRPANTMKAVNRKKRAALSKHDRLQDQNKSTTDRVLQTTPKKKGSASRYSCRNFPNVSN